MRGRSYALPDDRREMRAARYLHGRINEQTGREDFHLMALFSEGMRSSAFEGLLLSDLEYGVRANHDRLRKLMPVLNLETAPPHGQLAACNRDLGDFQT
jgi:phenylpropionate dioxygenase-like ring-hydroxylating dioxygenase large terminal subunit